MGGAVKAKWVPVFWKICSKKTLVFSGVPFPVIAWPQVSLPLNSRPMAYYRKGGTTPRLSFALWGAQPFGWHSYSYGHSQCYEYSNYYKLGVRSMGGVTIVLTRGMGKQFTPVTVFFMQEHFFSRLIPYCCELWIFAYKVCYVKAAPRLAEKEFILGTESTQ